MNRILQSAFFALSLSAAMTASAEPVRALSWNIEWFPGGRPNAKQDEKDKQFAAVQAELEKLKPDILLAQEVSDEVAFEKLVATMPGMKVDVFSRFPEPDSDKLGLQQCCIASNLKADSAFFEPFKPTANLPNLRRGFAFAALFHPDGGLIMVYSVHLKSNGGSNTPEGEQDVANTRAESVRQILAHKAEMEKRFAGRKIAGWLIGGDFNTNHDGQFPKCTVVADLVKAGFHNSWDSTPKDQRLTWHNPPWDKKFKPTTFDYMMTMGFREKQAKAMPDPLRGKQGHEPASDHDPVGLLLEVK
ncbi:endonuclease/exonuclease/phosphatase family protein [Akkermansiaceae bacterium]|nr:endonuclease/exonuclease/phosphatase family protein [Akkermansiaceae bacterium]